MERIRRCVIMIEMSTIEMTWIMWKSNNLHDINIMIDRFEKRHSLLNNMGIYSISNAKEGLGIYSISNAKELWKLDAMISKLKKLRELLEDE